MHFSTRNARPYLAALAAASLGAAAQAGVIIDSPDGFALRSEGSTSLGADVFVDGSAGARGAMEIGWNAKITGLIEKGPESTWKTPDLGKLPEAGTKTISLGWKETVALDPGAWGKVAIGDSATLLLSAGDYAVKSFSSGWAGTVVADTSKGDVYLYVNGSLKAGDEARFLTTGPGSLYLITGGESAFGYKSQLTGMLYSQGSTAFGSESLVNGYVWSGGAISAGWKSEFNYSAPIPAPGAAALGLAALAVARRRRR